MIDAVVYLQKLDPVKLQGNVSVKKNLPLMMSNKLERRLLDADASSAGLRLQLRLSRQPTNIVVKNGTETDLSM